MNNKGQPTHESDIMVEHQGRAQSPQPVKEYWTQHRITLIAYEAQYIYSKKPSQFLEEKNEEADKKKKSSRKKVSLEYEAGFLHISPQLSQEFKVEDLVKDYEHLNWLFSQPLDQNFEEVKTLTKIMLELKHSIVTRQFCSLYNIIIGELKNVLFSTVQKEEPRFKWLNNVRELLTSFLVQNKTDFPILGRYLQEDQNQTKKLFLVEAYCFLAEKFNFNINQFYSEAFSVPAEGKPNKKVKRSS